MFNINLNICISQQPPWNNGPMMPRVNVSRNRGDYPSKILAVFFNPMIKIENQQLPSMGNQRKKQHGHTDSTTDMPHHDLRTQ